MLFFQALFSYLQIALSTICVIVTFLNDKCNTDNRFREVYHFTYILQIHLGDLSLFTLDVFHTFKRDIPLQEAVLSHQHF